ncbi:MAG: hypothetical protein CME06_11320 [Gemmatimonadetes bacterium]|nr:hypothetical protein [Gemmatimonadota bacterium]
MDPKIGRKIGWIVGICALVAAGTQLSYVDWRPAVAPVDTRPLVILNHPQRDGRFRTPRRADHRHNGIDFAALLESPVRAVRGGRVAEVGTHPNRGLFIDLDHGDQLMSRYAHLRKTNVKKGDRVRQGELIGRVGKTGNARDPSIPPYLHFEVRRDNSPIDPLSLGLSAAWRKAGDTQ